MSQLEHAEQVAKAGNGLALLLLTSGGTALAVKDSTPYLSVNWSLLGAGLMATLAGIMLTAQVKWHYWPKRKPPDAAE